MNVKCAKEHIEKIKKICNEINLFAEKNKNLDSETGFLCDSVAYLCDYRKVLESEIEKAELKI